MAETPEALSQLNSVDEILADYHCAIDAGKNPDPQDYLDRYPEHRQELEKRFAEEDRVKEMLHPLHSAGPVSASPDLQMNTDFQVGETIGNRWKVENIFHGGMGLVYVVMDRQTGERLAAKTYRDDRFAANPELGSRFEKEALAWIKLGAHPNVVQAKFIQRFRHKPFLFLEYVPGGNLLDRLPLTDLWEVQVFAIHFCDGMIHAARSGITAHRDIKPENCLLYGETVEEDPWYTLKISDFGLAKSFDDIAVAPDLPFVLLASDSEHPTRGPDKPGTVDQLSMIITRTGVAAGTPPYMAPEQFDDVKRVDIRADIYSFGVMLFQMITGRLPFSGCSLSEYRHLHQRVAPPELSMEEPACRNWLDQPPVYHLRDDQFLPKYWEERLRGISHILDRCLAKDPTNRYKDFQEIRQELAWEPEDRRTSYAPILPPGNPHGFAAGRRLRRPVPRRLTEDELLSRGLSCLELGQENLALAAFDQLIERYPRNRRGHLEKAKLLMTMPHRYDEGCAILERAESIGDGEYTQLDAETHLPKILDSIVDKLFEVFEQADRAFVIFRQKKSRRLVVKVSRTRSPQDGDSTQVFLSDKRRIRYICHCLDYAKAIKCLASEFYEGPAQDDYLVMSSPMCDAYGKAFGAICLQAKFGRHNRATFTSQDVDLLREMVEDVIPPWIFPFLRVKVEEIEESSADFEDANHGRNT
jgi:serine/threonine protein kinase